ncbi:MAG TPA: hypothetical protein PK950_01855 [Candidatus Paceibacterota bacterium]|nr:hypothetical protein [Candidatus Paceibacterota bacterium]
MKKLLILAIGAFALTFTACTSDAEKETQRAEIEAKRIEAIRAQGDLAVINAYMNGDDSLKRIVISISSGQMTDWNVDNKIMFSALKKVHGTEMAAAKIYGLILRDILAPLYYYEGITFDNSKQIIDEMLAAMPEDVRNSFIAQIPMSDPFMVYNYVDQKGLKLLLDLNENDAVDCLNKMRTSSDSVFAKELIKSLDDSTIVNNRIGSMYSKEKRMSIVKGLPYSKAVDFLSDSEGHPRELMDFIKSRSSEARPAELLVSYESKLIISTDLQNMLKARSTAQLAGVTGEFRKEYLDDMWDEKFSFDDYAWLVVYSVKNIKDYKMAVDFFNKMEKSATWIPVLDKHTNF